MRQISIVFLLFISLVFTGCATSAGEIQDANQYELVGTETDGTHIITLDVLPSSWNPHTWLSYYDLIMLEFVVTPFVGNYESSDGTRVFEYEAAASVTDITKEFDDKAKWGIDEGAESGFVWQIDLNSALRWDDGTPISADTYIWSMRQLLEPGAKFYRAGRYSSGSESIRGAFAYRNNDKVGEAIFSYAVDTEITDDTVFVINPDAPSYFFNDESMAEYYETGFQPIFFTDCEYGTLIEKYRGETGYVFVTDEIKAELNTLAAAFGINHPESWIYFSHVITGTFEHTLWEDVGLIKADDYTLLYIASTPMTEAEFLNLIKRNWIVKDGAFQREGYNISDNTASFGPYRMVSSSVNEIILEKNEQWYGWDGKPRHGLYSYEEFGNYDRIIIRSAEPAEDESLFLSAGEPGETFPFPFTFNAEDLYGNKITQADLGDKEIFFVHLWATWCGPCVVEMPDLAQIADMYKESVGFLGLLTDFHDNPQGARRLVEHYDLEMINIHHLTEGLEELVIMVNSGAVPTTVIIDGSGKIIGEQIVGSFGMGYVRFIEAALAYVRGE